MTNASRYALLAVKMVGLFIATLFLLDLALPMRSAGASIPFSCDHLICDGPLSCDVEFINHGCCNCAGTGWPPVCESVSCLMTCDEYCEGN
jgi:hypothetical protein